MAASPRLLTPELADEIASTNSTDLTIGCYVIADGGTGRQHRTRHRDRSAPHRAGRCYAAGLDIYGLAGEMPIVAHAITELLHRPLETNGTQATLRGPCHADGYDHHWPLPVDALSAAA